MGLSISDIIPREEIKISDLKGKMLCVDAFNTLYQFLTTIRQPDGTPLMDNKGRVTSHLSGIFYRNIALLAEGIKLVYVFDGKPPDLKYKTFERREESRETSRERYEEARKEEDVSAMKRYGSQLVRLNSEMIEESKELLEAMGIGVVQAPGEGEAEAAYLARIKDRVYASVSQDYDSLLFGAPKLIRNLTLAKKKKTIRGWIEVNPEMIDLEKVLNMLNINLDQLICLGILVGTDYNPKGIPGIGQKKALQIVQKFRQPVMIFKSVEEQMNNLDEENKFDWKEIFSLFHKPNVSNSEIKFSKMNPAKIRKILVDKHDFSEERIAKQLEKMEEFEENNKQKDLNKWF
ncbi:MAG TPA: flap endonuclease-1 [Candidatus Omnitrophota bacterium]|nr:flap endonuclease-1 [Candidatus Omnitrophota bacterium]